jgi:serine/threonine protein kinase
MIESELCLSGETLEQLSGGELPPATVRAIETHVDDCETCRQLLAAVESDSQWQDEICPVLRTRDDLMFPSADHADEEHETQTLASVLRLLGPTDDPHMLGRIGEYEIVSVIGRGGMGIVFKAFDARLNRFVAIKMLLPHLAASGAARKRFAREGRAAAAVIDDNVMPIYSVNQWQGTPYLVTQYSRGKTVQQRIQEQGPLEVKEILRIAMQTARGLEAAHAQGLVHRDVKPSNILLDGTVERAMLTDFGLARAVDDASITRTGTLAGTPQYMSPEQARGDNVDARSDLFGLGCVIYAMCTGRPPFRADNSYAILRLIADEDARPIQEINADAPVWLCAIVSKLMSKRAEDRYADAAEVAEQCKTCLAHVQQPTTVQLPNSLVPTKKAVGSLFGNRKNVLFYAAAILGFSVFGMMLWEASNPSNIEGRWSGPDWGEVSLKRT